MGAVAVIVVNHNGGGWLARCLASVLGQRPAPAEVVVVDNASTDGTPGPPPPGVRIVRCERNAGFGAGVRTGMAATTAPFVCVLNADVALEPGFLSAAADALQADPGLGAVSPRVLRDDDPERIDATAIGLTSRLGPINCDSGRLEAELDDEPADVLGPLGGVSLWRRAALERVGGFPDAYFLYWEEMDASLRLLGAGFGCRTVPTARARHGRGASVGRLSALNVYYMVRNHAPCLLASLPEPVLHARRGALFLAPLRAAALYAARGRGLPALRGWIASLALLRAARRRRPPSPEPGTTERLTALMAAADRNRLAMKASARAGRGAAAP